MYWLKERIRDLFLWPINLVRDFPRRSGRFLATCQIGLNTFTHLPQELKKAKQNQNTLKRLGAWTHRLLVSLFDILGGPEIAQFFMHLLTYTSPLTAKEVQMMQAIFGEDGMRYHDIRVAQGGLMKYIFQRNGNLAFATWYTINLPKHHSKQTATPARQNLPIVVHELTHVYQYHHVGTCYMTEAIYVLIKHNRDCYRYGGEGGLLKATQNQLTIADYNREQQAQIVQDYFAKQKAGQDVTHYLPFIEQARSGNI